MTLTARISGFFLGVLACVLVGFAAALYFLASGYLHRQVDERLEAALGTLAAAVEFSDDGVEWEPNSRALTLGQDAAVDQVRWLVRNGQGREVDRSRNLSSVELFETLSAADGETSAAALAKLPTGDDHRVQHLVISAPVKKKHRAAPPEPTLTSLRLSVETSLAPVEATLRTLGLTLAGLSIGLWLLAAVAGRWLCRRALAPVARMADAAREMTADAWQTRLPSPGTRDELEDLARAFNDLLTRLQESFERQRRFTGDASHQLRTPLAGMLGQLDVALLRERDPDEYRRVLETVQAQGERLRQIVEMLLFLARADAEALEPQLSSVDLAAWLREHLATWQEHPRATDLQLELSDGDGAVPVRTHAALLGQLLDNLLDNAVKYSPSGTPIRVQLSTGGGRTKNGTGSELRDRVPGDSGGGEVPVPIFRPATAWANIVIEDSGDGIAAGDLPQLFQPFFRSPEARRKGVGGAGLGLAVAQRIALALGGEIMVENAAGGGARFMLRLPIAAGIQMSPTLELESATHVAD